jgi:cation transport regulator ChaB
MPYNTLADLPPEIKKLPEGAQKIFLATFNSAFSGTCKGREDREACAFAIAWSAVKRQYIQEDGVWKKKEGAAAGGSELYTPWDFEIVSAGADKALIISGPLIEIDKLNLNGWGVPESEVSAVVAGLKDVPLRMCSGKEAITNGHSCDYNWNPEDDIGTVVSAFRENGWIHATAKVTDSVAARKIREGTWAKKWSIFMSYKSAEVNGMFTGIKPRSVTLVREPAYPGAGFTAGAHDEGVEAGGKWTRAYINSLPDSAFAVIEPCYGKTTDNKNARHLPFKNANGEIDKPHLRNALARVEQIKPICEDTNRETLINKAKAVLEKNRKALEAAGVDINRKEEKNQMAEGDKYTKEDLDKAVAAAKKEGQEALEKAVAAAKAESQAELEKAVAAAKADGQDALKGMMPRAEAEKLISAAVEQAKSATIEQLTKERLMGEVVEMQVYAGMIKPEEAEGVKEKLKLKSAAQLEEDKQLLVRVKTALEAAGASAVDKFKKAQLPAQGESGPGGFTVGRPTDKGWEA